jgi:hypothetical protein
MKSIETNCKRNDLGRAVNHNQTQVQKRKKLKSSDREKQERQRETNGGKKKRSLHLISFANERPLFPPQERAHTRTLSLIFVARTSTLFSSFSL